MKYRRHHHNMEVL